jgi:predicted AAA+ superfamily ATPase
MSLVKRFLGPIEGSFFLLGPRGTGKTLWLRDTFPNAFWVDLLLPENFRFYIAKPERLTDEIKIRCGNNQPLTVVVDEVQRIPILLDVVHSAIVQFPNARFVLSGSSARKLRRGGVNLLGGRASIQYMHPFWARELGEKFSMDVALRHGLLPVIWNAPDAERTLSAYVGGYLEEEVKQEALVRKLGAFSRFLEAAAFAHGTIPNCSAMARECGISANTAEAYLAILHDLLIAFSVPPFGRRPKRRDLFGAKFYFCDAGLCRSLRPARPGLIDASIQGFTLEGLVAQHLRAWCDYSEGNHRLYFWRGPVSAEVDFVLCGDRGLWALEVKTSETIHPEHLLGLHTFQRTFPESKLILLYGGTHLLRRGDVCCIPLEWFLRELHPNQIPGMDFPSK